MARGVNKVILVGNLGQDPDVRYTGSGTAVVTMSIATSEKWTDKQTGEPQERTEWHRVKLFGKLAEVAGEYLKKGRQVYVEGSLRHDKYTDREGIERFTTDVIANELQMLGGQAGSRAGDGYADSRYGGGVRASRRCGSRRSGIDHGGQRPPAHPGRAVKPNTERPDACAISGTVHIFVGGYHQVLSIAAAESLVLKTNAAIEQAKQQEAVKA